MDSLAYLSVLLIPILMGIGILGFFAWQFHKDRQSEKPGRMTWPRLIVTLLFWLLFIGYFVWRAQTDGA